MQTLDVMWDEKCLEVQLLLRAAIPVNKNWKKSSRFSWNVTGSMK